MKQTKEQRKEYHKEYYLKNKECINKKNRAYSQQTNHAAQKRWYLRNKERVDAYQAQWYKDNIETIKEKRKIYFEKNKEKVIEQLKKSRNKPENKIKREKYRLEYYLKNKEKVLKRTNAWKQNNKDRVRRNAKQNRLKNIEHHRKYHAAYTRQQRRINPRYIVRGRLCARINMALRYFVNEGKRFNTLTYTGCSIDFLVKHIEKQFKNGMNWENRNKWHIDHIKPCASFDLTDVKQQLECFHYTNLQPLWAVENIKKGAR